MNCAGSRFQDYPDYSSTLVSWTNRLQRLASAAEEDGSFDGWLLAGACENGPRFLYSITHYTWDFAFFNDSDEFLGTSDASDAGDNPCGGTWYFPEPVLCSAAKVTQVIHAPMGPTWAELQFAVGSPVDVPWQP